MVATWNTLLTLRDVKHKYLQSSLFSVCPPPGEQPGPDFVPRPGMVTITFYFNLLPFLFSVITTHREAYETKK